MCSSFKYNDEKFEVNNFFLQENQIYFNKSFHFMYEISTVSKMYSWLHIYNLDHELSLETVHNDVFNVTW